MVNSRSLQRNPSNILADIEFVFREQDASVRGKARAMCWKVSRQKLCSACPLVDS